MLFGAKARFYTLQNSSFAALCNEWIDKHSSKGINRKSSGVQKFHYHIITPITMAASKVQLYSSQRPVGPFLSQAY
jgi:hypothetical protein